MFAHIKKIISFSFIAFLFNANISYAMELLSSTEEDEKRNITHIHKVIQDSAKVDEIKKEYGTTFSSVTYRDLPPTYETSPKFSNSDNCPYIILDKNWAHDGIKVPGIQDCIVTVIRHTPSQQVLVIDLYRDHVKFGPCKIIWKGLGTFNTEINNEWSQVDIQLVSLYHSPHLKAWVDFLEKELNIMLEQIKADIAEGAITQEEMHTTIYIGDNLDFKDFEKGKNIFISKEGNLSPLPSISHKE